VRPFGDDSPNPIPIIPVTSHWGTVRSVQSPIYDHIRTIFRSYVKLPYVYIYIYMWPYIYTYYPSIYPIFFSQPPSSGTNLMAWPCYMPPWPRCMCQHGLLGLTGGRQLPWLVKLGFSMRITVVKINGDLTSKYANIMDYSRIYIRIYIYYIYILYIYIIYILYIYTCITPIYLYIYICECITNLTWSWLGLWFYGVPTITGISEWLALWWSSPSGKLPLLRRFSRIP
jgi:hypothetical protein